MHPLYLAFSFIFWKLAAGQTATSSSAGPTPSCLQPRQPSDPIASTIDSVLASAIPNACNPQLEDSETYKSNSIRTYHVQSYNFNISQDAASQVAPAAPACTNAFQSIISTCVEDSSGPGFWGGWIILDASNYSISDFEYPKNALLSASSALNSPTTNSNAGDTGSIPSKVTNTASGLAPTGHETTASDTGTTGFPPSESTNVVSGTASSDPSSTMVGLGETVSLPPGSTDVAFGTGRGNLDSMGGTTSNGMPGSPSKTRLSGRSSGILGSTICRGTESGTGQPGQRTGSGEPIGTLPTISGDSQGPTTSGSHGAFSATGANPSNTFGQPGSSFGGTTAGQSGTEISNTGSIQPSSAPLGSEPATTGPDGTGTGSSYDGTSGSATGSGNGALSGDLTGTLTNSGGNTVSSGFSPGVSQSSGAASSLNARPTSGQNTGELSSTKAPSSQTSSVLLSQDTAGLSNTNTGAPSNQNPSEPSNTASSGGSQPDTAKPSNGPITPPPAIPTTPVDRQSPQATSDGVVLGGVLFGLSKSAKSLSNDITIPATKTAFLNNIKDTENQLETLFKDMGGTLPPDTGGCSSGARKKKRGLGSFVGDIFNTVRCAINSLDTLKGDLDVREPDISTIEGDLDDVGTLAKNIDENDENDEKDSSTNDQDSTKEQQTENPSTNEPSTNEPSSKDQTSKESSTRSSSSQQPSSASASTTGTMSSASDTCGGCCPTEEPLLPTDGTPAVTAAPTDFDTLDKRAVAPGRLRRLVKRGAAKPLTKLNQCNLQTPNNLPVTIPAYPGGFEFYTSDTLGQLGSLTTISRYYRSTTTGNPACTPTITQINAAQWTFSQTGNVPENDKVSVDHAYEIGFLKSFMESLIDKSNGITCKDANAQFFDQGTCPDNRLEPIFGSLPSFQNPDFIAMSQWLNGDAKGWVLGPDYDPQLAGSNSPGSRVRPSDNWATAMKKIKNKMKLAQILVEAALIINADNTLATMQKTNNRIYAAFKAHEMYLSQHAGLPRANFGWAAKYKTYMDNYVNYRNGASARLLGPLLTTIANDLNVANNNVANKVPAEIAPWTNLHGAMKSYYTGSGAGVSDLNWAINWEWNTANVKREEFENAILKRQACSRPTGTQQSTGQATGSVTGSSGGDGSTNKPDASSTVSTNVPDATSTDSPSPTKTSAPASQSCSQDSDCNDYKCSSGDPFCAIAISKLRKRENACIALGTCPGANDHNGDSTTASPPAKGTDAPEAFPTGFCGCKNQDPLPSKTSNTPTTTQPPAEGCTSGLYNNFDDCSAHCKQGMCNENAGQPQITCACN
ncbi:MAG: hypothetical protein Q9225_007328 [Loekoesia sp. 1 TL-2023]